MARNWPPSSRSPRRPGAASGLTTCANPCHVDRAPRLPQGRRRPRRVAPAAAHDRVSAGPIGPMVQCDFEAGMSVAGTLQNCLACAQKPSRPGGDMVVREVARLGQGNRTAARSIKRNNKLQSIGKGPYEGVRVGVLIRGTTFHDLPRHAAALQLLAKRLLRAFAILLHSKKILTIGIRNTSTVVVFYTGGHCSVQSIEKVAAWSRASGQVTRR